MAKKPKVKGAEVAPIPVAEERDGAVQYAALPYRTGPDGLRVLLITSRETRRWVIPKGWPMKGRKPHDAAAREAYEEAGIVGRVRSRAIGSYVYPKRLRDGTEVQARVRVFPFEFLRRKKRWPEKGERESAWFAPAEAAGLVAEAGLAEILTDFSARPSRKPKSRVQAKDGKGNARKGSAASKGKGRKPGAAGRGGREAEAAGGRGADQAMAQGC